METGAAGTEIPMQKLRFDPSVNFGQVITAGAFFVSLMGMVWWQSDFQATTRANQKVTDENRARYLPLIDAMTNAQGVTNDRLNNIAIAIDRMRGTNDNLGSQVNILSNRITALETTFKNMPMKMGANEQ